MLIWGLGERLERLPGPFCYCVPGKDKRVRHAHAEHNKPVECVHTLSAFLIAFTLRSAGPDVLVRVDNPGRPGAPTEVRGAANWAKGAVAFSRLVRAVQPALVDGAPGLVFAPGGRLTRVLMFKIAGGRIVEFEVIANPERLEQLNLSVLNE